MKSVKRIVITQNALSAQVTLRRNTHSSVYWEFVNLIDDLGVADVRMIIRAELRETV